MSNKKHTSTGTWWTPLAALAGAVFTAILTATHYRIADQGLMQKSFCTLSSVIDCDTVLISDYAHLWRIPVSELGFLFYVTVFVLGLWALASEERRGSLYRFITLISLGGLAYGIFYSYLMIVKLEVICLFCFGGHVATLVIFVSALLAGRKNSAKQAITKYVPYAVSMLVIFGLGLMFFFGANERAHAAKRELDTDRLLEHFYSQKPVTLAIKDRPTYGPADAPITIWDFSDFQCPFCRRAAFSLKPYLGAYRSQVKLTYLHFPLDSRCNPEITRAMHPAACIAAKAASCAYQQDPQAFWPFHDAIFENQKQLSRSVIVDQLAADVGLDRKALNECMASDDTDAAIKQDVAWGVAAEVRGTPSVYINGRYLRGWTSPEVLQAVIAAELERLRDPNSKPAQLHEDSLKQPDKPEAPTRTQPPQLNSN